MKSVFHKIVSFSMALIVLFSTFSFAVEQHYCGNTLVDISVLGKAESCGMEQQSTISHEHNIEKNRCCEDQTLLISGQHDLKLSLEKLSFEQLQFVVSYIYLYINLFEDLEENSNPHNHYPPPFLVKDILILDQTFLI